MESEEEYNEEAFTQQSERTIDQTAMERLIDTQQYLKAIEKL